MNLDNGKVGSKKHELYILCNIYFFHDLLETSLHYIYILNNICTSPWPK